MRHDNSEWGMLGFLPASILIPDLNSDGMTKWSVVACDQFTSEPEYWENVKQQVGDSPSTFNMIFPEAYLDKVDKEDTIEKINMTIQNYIDMGIFKTLESSFIFVERTLRSGKVRQGIVGCIDLEMYDYTVGASSMIRATEGTVLDRIPPRVSIRENAPIELPHVMVLIDDEQGLVVESIEKRDVVYDFDLMQNSGHLKGYRIAGDALANMKESLINLYEKKASEQGKKISDGSTLLYVVGDGNHSLATAKTCWENIKARTGVTEHPARYALVELVNIHDKSLDFEPIHRILTGVEPAKVIDALKSYYDVIVLTEDNLDSKAQIIVYKYGAGKSGKLLVKNPSSEITVGTLQKFIDDYIKENSDTGIAVDYIHGDEVLSELSAKQNSIGFILPKPSKASLFSTVISDGVLPRKTFSMGEAYDKRFYLEGKLI
jgi:uncharacterized protein (DUF1015 family)